MLEKTYSNTMTLLHTVVDRFSKEKKLAFATEPKAQGKIHAPLTADVQFVISHNSPVHPIIKLWILRLLMPLECHHKFIRTNSFLDNEIARLFSFQTKSDIEIENDFTNEIEIALREALNPDDSPEMENHGAPKKTTNDFDANQALIHLKHCYLQTEKVAATIELPQPLADNIKQLAAQVGLSQVESQILAFAVLMHTQRILETAINWLEKLNKHKVYHVLSVLLGFTEVEIREALSRQSVLSQTALLVLSDDRYSGLGGMLNLLSGSFSERFMMERGSPVDWLRDMIIPSQSPHLSLADYPHLQNQLDFLLPYLRKTVDAKQNGINVFLYGAPGTGKTQLSRVLAQYLGCPLYEVASEGAEGNPVNGDQRLRACRTAQAFFQNGPALMLFDEVEDVFKDSYGSAAQTRKAWMNRLLEENPVPTFWLGNSIDSIDPAFIRRFDWVVELPIPPKVQRERIIRESCASVLTDKAIKRLAACEELAPAVVTRAAKVIGNLTDQFPVERLSFALQDLMDKTLIAQGHKGLNSNNSVRLPDFYDPDLLNCDADLTQLAIGIKRHGSARICLFGPPGTGKSAYSRWLAEYLGKPLHIKRGSDLLSMWVGGTEKSIAQAFQEAEQDNAVLLIDEIDSFLQERSSSQYSWEITRVNEMLTRMETYNGVFIASTNQMEGLDAASLRRFDLKVKFDALQPHQAWKLLQSHCHSLDLPEPENSLQFELQRLEGLTPGDFATLERQHLFRPITDAKAFVDALQAECALKSTYQRQSIGF